MTIGLFQVDVIVVSSSSEYLFEAICKAGGDSIKNSFDEESRKNPDARVVSVNAGGKATIESDLLPSTEKEF